LKAQHPEGNGTPGATDADDGSGRGKLFNIFKLASIRRATDHRRDFRYPGAVDKAIVVMAGVRASVRVGNISERGVMVKTSLEPEVGESVVVEFDGFAPLRGTVRWAKQGRVGIELA
jgi:hypothetical protein